MKKRSVLFVLLIVGVGTACVKHDLVTPAVQLNRDTTDIGNYLRTNGIEAIKIPPGVWYQLDSSGFGAYPVLSDSVKVSFYVWKLPTAVDPQITDTIQSSISVTSKSTTRTALLSTVISGLQAGLVRFPVGSRGRLYVPSGLAFGSTGSLAIPPHHQAIPPDANLLYEVELVGAAGTRLTADTAAVSNYVNQIAVQLLLDGFKKVRDPSGIWYSYDSIYQDSSKATLDKKIKLDLTTQVLGSTVSFSASDTSFVLKSTPVTAFKRVLPNITVGTKVTIYVPSGYGYGSLSPRTAIPANSNLIYTLKLKSVSN